MKIKFCQIENRVKGQRTRRIIKNDDGSAPILKAYLHFSGLFLLSYLCRYLTAFAFFSSQNQTTYVLALLLLRPSLKVS